jgi:Ni,Fe-hydrogenase III component G
MEIEVSKETAEDVVEQLDNQAQRMENTLQSFRSNNLTDTDAYHALQAEQQEIVKRSENIEEQIEEEEPEGLGELFG